MNTLAEAAIRYDRLHEENEQYKQENEQWKRENEEYKRENDQRFNILLEEVRASNRRISNLENP